MPSTFLRSRRRYLLSTVNVAARPTRARKKNNRNPCAAEPRILRLDRLRLRGPFGARDEFLLAATVQKPPEAGKADPIAHAAARLSTSVPTYASLFVPSLTAHSLASSRRSATSGHPVKVGFDGPQRGCAEMQHDAASSCQSQPRRCYGSGLAAGEDILLDDRVNAPISIYHLGDAEVDADRD